MKKILVVGGAGNIGSYVNQMLNRRGYETIVFDNLSRGSRECVPENELVVGDIRNPKDLEQLFQEHSFDAVMHFAALIDCRESCENPSIFYDTNVTGTIHLLDAMNQHGVKHLIFSSTAAIYGIATEVPTTESAPKKPINPYGRTKLIAEDIFLDYESAYGLKHCSLRYFNASGADPEAKIIPPRHEPIHLIPIILDSVFKGQPSIHIFGDDHPTPDGTCIRDYIHIHDLATAHILALEHLFEGKAARAYNLGNGHGASVKNVISAVEDITGTKVKQIIDPKRLGEPPELIADSSKAKQELSWKPQYPDIQSIVSHTWKSMQLQLSDIKINS